jgi:uncharacterized protein (TIGR03118 family)
VTSAQDPRLINSWGISRAFNAGLAENQWWVNDQVTGLSTLYDANGTIVDLAVTIPPASGTGAGSPTGTAFNPVTNSFAFVTLDGTLSLWSSTAPPTKAGVSCAACHTTTATIKVNHGASGASYQGLTLAENATSGALTYYVANANGGVEAYDATSFNPVTLPAGAFTDPEIPTTYTPANVEAFSTVIFVTYNASAGGGTGYVDVFDTNGKLLLRLQQGFFNQPWGVAVTPANFGTYSNMILVGNTGNGAIGVYKFNGAFQGYLKTPAGKYLILPGLWGLEFGNGNPQTGPTNVLYFAAGGANQNVGVFGAITAN